MTFFLFCLLFPTSVMLSHFHVLWTIAANEIYVMHTSCALIVQCLFTLTFFFSYFSLFSVIDNRQENGLALFFLFSFSLLTNWQLALKEASKDGNRIEERKKERLHIACYLSVCELEKIGSGNRQFLFFFLFRNKNTCTDDTDFFGWLFSLQICPWADTGRLTSATTFTRN